MDGWMDGWMIEYTFYAWNTMFWSSESEHGFVNRLYLLSHHFIQISSQWDFKHLANNLQSDFIAFSIRHLVENVFK